MGNPFFLVWRISGDANEKVQAYDLKDELILRKDTPLIRIYGQGSLSNFLQFVVK